MAKYKIGDVFREIMHPYKSWTIIDMTGDSYKWRFNDYDNTTEGRSLIVYIDDGSRFELALTPTEAFVQKRLKELGYAKV